MTIEDFINDKRKEIVKEFEEVKAKGKKIADKKSPSVDEMLDNSYEMGSCIGKLDFLNDLSRFVLKSNFEKMEIKING